MQGNLHVRFGVGAGVKLPRLHHSLVYGADSDDGVAAHIPCTPLCQRKKPHFWSVSATGIVRREEAEKVAQLPPFDGCQMGNRSQNRRGST